MKRHLSMLIMAIGLSFLISGCGAAKLSPEVQKTFDTNATMYTTKNMHYNISRTTNLVVTTNYQRGVLIPVNSKVTMADVNSRQIVFMLGNKRITLKNNAKHTGLGISDIAAEYFSVKKVNLSKFTSTERKAIKSASILKGMSKDAVLISLGRPPITRTPDLTMDTWVYWKNRWITFAVNFQNNRVLANTPTK